MTVLRAVARPMLASIFVIQGFDTMLHPERVAPRAEPVVAPLTELVPGVPATTEDAVRLNGAVQFAAGSLLALDIFPRLSALAIAATLVPTTAAGHRFWEVEDEKERAQQRIQFLKNLSIFGGLLIAAADTGGRPSLAWRSRHAVRSARRDVALATRAARVSGRAGARAGRAGARAGQASARISRAKARANRARASRAKANRARASRAKARANWARVSRASSRRQAR
jgi:putative oxidoreductase